MARSQSYVDVSLERHADTLEKLIDELQTNPDDSHVCAVARALQRLHLEICSRLPFYGKEYESGGEVFIALGHKAQSAAKFVPEKITRKERGTDRSAHALIARSAKEIAIHVKRICG